MIVLRTPHLSREIGHVKFQEAIINPFLQDNTSYRASVPDLGLRSFRFAEELSQLLR